MKKILLLVIPAMLLWNNNMSAQTALEFDGVDNYVDLGDNFNLTSYTKEAWVKWDGSSNPNNIVSGNANNPHALWAPAGGKLRAGHGSPFETVEDDDLIAGEWIHVSLTYNGDTGEMILYTNCEKGQRAFADPGFVLTDVTIGAFLFEELKNLFSGQIDDVRIWDYVRTPEEICGNYNECLTGTEDGLVAFYDFEDGAGSSTLADLTGNGHDGTLIDFDVDNDWVEGVNGCGEEEPEPECIEITSFYPNPTWNKVYLNLNASYNNIQVRVYNQWGYYCRGKYVSGPLDKVDASLYGLQGGRYYYVMVIDCETWKYDYVRVYKRSWC